MLTVFIILGLTVILFTTEKLPLDLTGLLALLALYLTGSVTTEEALAGFSNPVVVTLAALFVVGGALFRTGVAARFGTWLAEHGGSGESRILVLVMVSSAVLSAFMSSTGTVAILIPAVMGVAKKAGISPSRLLLPLAYGCLIGGMLTLVGTAPNLVVQEALIDGGYEKFNFFSFTPMGIVVLALGAYYMNSIGTKFLSKETDPESESESMTTKDLARDYALKGRVMRARITHRSSFAGLEVKQLALRTRYGINILGIQVGDDHSPLQEVHPDTVLGIHEILHLHGEPEDYRRMLAEEKLAELPPLQDYSPEIVGEHGLAEVLLTPRSRLVGKTLVESRFQARYDVTVISLKRMGKLLKNTEIERLRFGDTLLVSGRLERLVALRSERDNFVVTGMPEESEQIGFRHDKAWIAVLLALLMLGLMTFGILPSAIAVLLVASAAVLTGCLSSEDAYRSISWQSLILIAAMLPMAQALETSGGVQFVATIMNDNLGPLGPRFVMAGLFLLTSVFSQFISNTATTVIVAPIAIVAATQAGMAPHAFLMAVSVAASSAFVTPVASPVNLLVMAPGKYRFLDFVKIGLPLQLLVMGASLLILPLLFPLR
jgi:di/tricarboxylate transporter